MRITDIFMRANKNLARAKMRTILTVLAIFIGAFTVTLTTALGEGVKKSVDVQISSISAPNAIIVQAKPPEDSGNGNPAGNKPLKYNPKSDRSTGFQLLEQNDYDKVAKINGVNSVVKFNSVKTEYIASEKTQDKYQINLVSAMDGVELKVIAGTLPSASDDGYVILTEKYVQSLGFKDRNDAIGKKVTVAYLDVQGKMITREYTIKAILNNSFINNGGSYISNKESEYIAAMQTKDTPMAGKYGAVMAFGNKDATKEEMNTLRDRIIAAGYKAETLDDQIASLKGVITVVQLVIGLFGALTVIASIFGIVNTLLMSVYERTREIGLMKALGMGRGTVFSIFSIEAGSIGFWGGVLGVVLARLAGGALNSYLMSNNFLGFEGMEFFIFPMYQTVAIVVALTVVGLLAGVLPAMKAGSLDPIEALRHE